MRILSSLFLLALFASFSWSCKKSSSSPMTYVINGFTDITVRQYIDTTLVTAVGAVYTGGPQETLTLTVDSIPAGFTASPMTISGTPGFANYITFTGHAINAGAQHVVISAKSNSTGTKKYTFNIIATPGVMFNYNTTGLGDLSIPQYVNDTTINVNVAYVAGVNERVMVAADGAPSGVTISPDTVSGLPPFGHSFHFHLSSLSPGTYPVTVHTSSASTGSVAHNFNLVVVPSSNCSPEVTGGYTGNTNCVSYSMPGVTGLYPGTESVSGTSVTSEVIVQLPFATSILADLNCGSGALVTQANTTSDWSISAGTGTFTLTTMVLHYHITLLSGGSVDSDCTTTLTR